jgi:hypothetical protein
MTKSALNRFTTQFNRLHKIDEESVEFVCDFCSGPMQPENRVATYVSEATSAASHGRIPERNCTPTGPTAKSVTASTSSIPMRERASCCW